MCLCMYSTNLNLPPKKMRASKENLSIQFRNIVKFNWLKTSHSVSKGSYQGPMFKAFLSVNYEFS
jgi:hypothetical protein